MCISTSGPVFNSKSTTFQGVCLLGRVRLATFMSHCWSNAVVKCNQVIQFFSCLLKFAGRFSFVLVSHYDLKLRCHRIVYFREAATKTSSLVCHVGQVWSRAARSHFLKVSCGTSREVGAKGNERFAIPGK